MCIRDSGGTDTALALRTIANKYFDDGRKKPIIIIFITDGVPVSYTHLRAHETVLDLVCRLLLEKKKYQITPSVLHMTQTSH